MTNNSLPPTSAATRRYRVYIDQQMSHDISIDAPDIETAQCLAMERYESDRVLADYNPPDGWFVNYGIHEISDVRENCHPEPDAIHSKTEAAKLPSVRDTFGLVCPRCQQDDSLIVSASECVRLLPDGSESVGDQEWALDSAIHCSQCGHAGIVAEFADDDHADDPPPLKSNPLRLMISSDVCCELAHELTMRECTIRGLPLDTVPAPDDDESHYAEEAQMVFNAILDIVSGVLQPGTTEVVP